MISNVNAKEQYSTKMGGPKMTITSALYVVKDAACKNGFSTCFPLWYQIIDHESVYGKTDLIPSLLESVAFLEVLDKMTLTIPSPRKRRMFSHEQGEYTLCSLSQSLSHLYPPVGPPIIDECMYICTYMWPAQRDGERPLVAAHLASISGNP